MVFEMTTTLTPDAVFDRAVTYFSERVPAQAVFPEKRGANHFVFRGQGGEELVIMARIGKESETLVRGSTLLFDHLLNRFLTTLPVAGVAR